MDDRNLLRQRVTEVLENSNLNTRIRMTFTDDGSSWLLVVGKNVESIEETKDGEVTTEFKATFANALAIFNRKLNPVKAIATLKLKVTGELGLALKITELLKKPIPS